jgi:hypothetical protein
MHFTHLCRKCRSKRVADRPFEERFLRDQEAFQRTLLTSLRNDYYYSAFSDDAQVARNRELVSYWDWLSLMICLGFGDQRRIPGVPAAAGTLDLELTAVNGNRNRIMISPWPFREPSLALTFEGRHLLGTFSRQADMRRAFRRSSVIAIQVELTPPAAEAR